MNFKEQIHKQYRVVASPSREQAFKYVSFVISEEGKELPPDSLNQKTAILVGWQCGFEPLFVAIQDEDGEELHVSEADAEDIAKEFLLKKKWFSENEAEDCDYVWMP